MTVVHLLRHTALVSRPGFWPTQLWFYLLPLGGYRLLDQFSFWCGALYVMFPLGLLLYGWNDIYDARNDARNPRKGNWLFGAQSEERDLRSLPVRIVAVQLPFWILFTWWVGPVMLLWIAGVLATNFAYNSQTLDFKGRPVLDLLNQGGYLLVFVLSSWLNGVPQLPWPAFVFGALFAMHSHLVGQIMDYEPDLAAGRRTTAVVIGMVPSKLLLGSLLVLEAAFVHRYFSTPPLTAFLLLGASGFFLDAAVRKERSLSLMQMKLVMFAWNLAAVVSMHWVWRSAIFVQTAG